MNPVLVLEQVNKKYHLGTNRSGLREVFFFLEQKKINSSSSDPNDLWAVRNVSFEVHSGEVLGIFGRNGAGKTTILKLISRVTRPTSGRIHVNGHISALIELGAGFHPDLTGRENIFLNGVILGLNRKEISRKFDSIVSFSELEQFIDTPVKRYSSGMYARLGFSVAAHADPDLLLVDEVLAVGDGAFQQKCYDFILSYVSTGKTAVFVSHNLYVIEQLCNRVIWLEGGQIEMMGDPSEVLPHYFDRIDQSQLEQKNTSDLVSELDGLSINQVRFPNSHGSAEGTFAPGEEITVQIEYSTNRRIRRPHFVLGVSGPNDKSTIFIASMLVDQRTPEFIQGRGMIACTFKNVRLTPKVYQVWGEVWDEDRSRILFKWQKLGAIRISDDTIGQVGKGGLRHSRSDAPVLIDYDWHF